MRERGVTMWEQYNALPDVEPLRPIAVFIDDATPILESNSAIHDMLAEIIIQLRKTGVFFILSSQEMSSKSMRPMIRRQLSSRFAFHVADAWQTQGLGIGREAVDLNVKGRAWIILPGQQKMLVQTPFVASYEIKQLLTQSGRLATNEEEDNG
jgi:DNA segregation ATPase FtsK/SpoIIIE-like protein